jgi:hypothetical protein
MISTLPLLLALATPIPPPVAGGESYSEIVELLETVQDPKRARALSDRGRSMYRPLHPAGLMIDSAADKAAARLGLELPRGEAPEPYPKRMPRTRAGSSEARWLSVAGTAAALAYEPVETIQAQLKRWRYRPPVHFENTVPGTRAFLAERQDHVLVAFCGTELDVLDALVDVSIDQIRAGPFGGGRIHRGFATQLASIWGPLEKAMDEARTRDPNRPFVFTGHSLGGAVATLAYARARASMRFPTLRSGAPSARLVTLGAPRVGDETFASGPVFREDAVVRVIYRQDPVPHALARGLGYHHPVKARTLWIDDTPALHELAPEDPARDELPQDLKLESIKRWLDEGEIRFRDHSEWNYTVLLRRLDR